jgi:hypothetical protein
MSFSSNIRYFLLVAAAAMVAACGDPAAPEGIHTDGGETPGGGTTP